MPNNHEIAVWGENLPRLRSFEATISYYQQVVEWEGEGLDVETARSEPRLIASLEYGLEPAIYIAGFNEEASVGDQLETVSVVHETVRWLSLAHGYDADSLQPSRQAA